jgi:acetyltransferase-like isoleucine patch superfamily enzyme
MRDVLKRIALVVATIVVLPGLISYAVRRLFVGPNRALEGSTQALSLVPGYPGDLVRRAFLGQVLARCDWTSTVQFGTIFSQAGARIGRHVYVGPRCHLGLVQLEDDVLLAAGVHVPSGAQTHGTGSADESIREQPGQRSLVTVGQGTWVGSAAVIMADVGKHCVIGAGAVVTKPIPDYSVAVGVPARVVKTRRPEGRT